MCRLKLRGGKSGEFKSMPEAGLANEQTIDIDDWDSDTPIAELQKRILGAVRIDVSSATPPTTGRNAKHPIVVGSRSEESQKHTATKRVTRSQTVKIPKKRKKVDEETDDEWDEEREEAEAEVKGRLRKKSKRDNWPGLRTRSSPIQLARCINVLSFEQRTAVKQMGFGRLLKFKVDGMPAKLANYVVERFNPSTMEINLPCGDIKVNLKAIHKLLGIPRSGIKLSSLPKLAEMDEAVRGWKNRFTGRFVSPTRMVDMIESSDEGDSFNFRMDFLMCFVTLMIDCHKQGFLLGVG
ncbi:hypothetical protein Hanom_Chr11g01013001 [Helianthus anomalus]